MFYWIFVVRVCILATYIRRRWPCAVPIRLLLLYGRAVMTHLASRCLLASAVGLVATLSAAQAIEPITPEQFMLHAAKNEAGLNVWKLWVIKDSRRSR